MNTDHHQPKVFRGDAKKEGESDDAHQRRVQNNAKSRAFAAAARQKRLVADAKNNAARAAGQPMRGFDFLGGATEATIEEAIEAKNAAGQPIRGFAFSEEATEVTPLVPVTNVTVAAPASPPATVVASPLPVAVPTKKIVTSKSLRAGWDNAINMSSEKERLELANLRLSNRVEELEALLRIKDQILVHHIKECATQSFIIGKLEALLARREE